MSISIPAVKRASVSYTGGALGLNLVIPDASHYTRFIFQVTGFTVGTQISIQGSVNGKDWAPLDPASTFVPTLPFAATAAGIIIALDTYAPLPGGIRFVLSAPSVAAGTIDASMTASPYNTNRA